MARDLPITSGMRPSLAVLPIVVVLFAAAPAQAATICVPLGGPGCDSSAVSLQGAVDIANGNAVRDTIRIAGGFTTSENVTVGSGNPVDIIGSGRGAGDTVLTSPNSAAVLLVADPTSTVSDLRIVVPDSVTNFEQGLDLSEPGALGQRLTVVGGTGLQNAVGVFVRTGATLRDSLVEVPMGSANYAVDAEDGTLLEDLSLAGEYLISGGSSGPPVIARRIRSSQPSGGIRARAGVTMDVTDALIRLAGGSSSSYAFEAGASLAGDSTIIARHVTIVGNGAVAEQGVGAYAWGEATGVTGTVDLRDSIFHALSTDVQARTFGGADRARIVVDHSDVNPAKQSASGPGTEEIVLGPSNVLADPGFVNAAALDFHLGPNSALIDRGFPGAGSTTDLDRLPRPNDGNGDGTAVRDIGAYEYQRPATPPPVDTQAPVFSILSRRLKLDRNRRVRIILRAPANESGNSSGTYGLRTARKVRVRAGVRRRLTLGRARLVLAPTGNRVRVRLRLNRRNARIVRRLGRVRVVLTVTLRDATGNSATKRKRLMLTAVLPPRV